jgi:hypothetical protein
MPTLEALTAYLLSAMTSWVPVDQHRYYETAAETEDRYRAIAQDIALVALDPEEAPLFAGDEGRAKTALLLASVASFESTFNGKVDDCRVSGDGGRAHGLWQTHAPKAQVCADRLAAARIALRMVRDSFTQCRAQSLPDKLSHFTDGFCKHDWGRSRLRVERATKYWSAHPRQAS